MKMQKELYSSKEYERISKIKIFNHTLNIFVDNYKEFRSFLFTIIGNPNSIELFGNHHSDELRKIQQENIRLLHNYVASAFTLIDHTRIHYRELYEADNTMPDYQTEVSNRFKNNPLASFIVGLRQYAQHYKSPSLSTQLIWNRNEGMKTSLCINKNDISDFNWSSKAKEYLKNCEDYIDVLQLIDEYYKMVVDFYSWFKEKQNEIHTTDFEIFDNKQKEYFGAVIPYIIDTLEQSIRKGDMSLESILFSSFEKEEVDEIEAFENGSDKRFDKLLVVIEKRCVLKIYHKEKLRQLFNIKNGI